MKTSSNIAQNKPEFIRLPKAGQKCPWTGLSRSALNELILANVENPKPPVHSILMRKRGAMRGIRLIDFDSLLNYINGFDGKGNHNE